jgi:hypothetical protein
MPDTAIQVTVFAFSRHERRDDGTNHVANAPESAGIG